MTDGGDGFVDLVFVGDVGLVDVRASASVDDLRGDLLGGFVIDIEEGDGGALGRECAGDLGADSGATAGERDHTRQVTISPWRPWPSWSSA